MSAQEIEAELVARLPEVLGAEVAVQSLNLLAGGASKEAWALDAAVDGETVEQATASITNTSLSSRLSLRLLAAGQNQTLVYGGTQTAGRFRGEE